MGMNDQSDPPAAFITAKGRGYPLQPIGGSPHSWSGRFTEEKNRLPLSGIESRFLGLPTLSLATVLTEQPRPPIYIM